MCKNVKNGVEIIFYFYNIFQVILDIIQNDEDPKPQNVDEFRKINYWPKWKKAMHAELQLLIKQEVFGPIVQMSKSIKLVGSK